MKLKHAASILLSVTIIFGVLTGCQANMEGTSETQQTEGADSTDEIQSNSEGTVLRIGAQPFPLYSSVYVAKELGFLEEELDAVGATYEWTEFNSGPLVNEAVAAKTQDIGFMADMPAIIAKSSGQDIQIISNVAYGEKALALLVAADSKISSVQELEGKKVAYVTGSYAQHLLSLLLDEAGLSFDDIQSVNLPASDQPSALESGQVDAIVVWEQYISLLENDGVGKVIADGTGIKRGNMVTYAVTDYAGAHPEVIEAYIKACQRASEYIDENAREAAEAIAEDFGVNVDIMEKILEKFFFDPNLSEMDIEGIAKVKYYLLEEGIIENDIDIDSFINTVYLEAAYDNEQ